LESVSVLSTSSADEGSDQPSGNFQQNVLARLRKLEEIVITQREPTRSPSDQSGSRPGPPPSRGKRDISTSFNENTSTVDVEWLESQITHPGSTVGLCITEYGKQQPTRVSLHALFPLVLTRLTRVQNVLHKRSIPMHTCGRWT
jgi:hypothetical protein